MVGGGCRRHVSQTPVEDFRNDRRTTAGSVLGSPSCSLHFGPVYTLMSQAIFTVPRVVEIIGPAASRLNFFRQSLAGVSALYYPDTDTVARWDGTITCAFVSVFSSGICVRMDGHAFAAPLVDQPTPCSRLSACHRVDHRMSYVVAVSTSNRGLPLRRVRRVLPGVGSMASCWRPLCSEHPSLPRSGSSKLRKKTRTNFLRRST